jgi:HEAT repeat protein
VGLSQVAVEPLRNMAIDAGVDSHGHSLRMLVSQSLERYQTSHLFQFLQDRGVIVRSAAARRLQLRGTREVFEHALSLAHSKSRRNREIAAFLLGQLGTPQMPYRGDSLPVLCILCSDRAPEVRAASIAALGHLRAVELADVVTKARRDSNQAVRAMSVYVSGRLRDLKNAGN